MNAPESDRESESLLYGDASESQATPKTLTRVTNRVGETRALVRNTPVSTRVGRPT